MKIKKLSKLNNAFSYSFFDWDKVNPAKGNNPNDPIDIFKKSNILFAENGNGKSKLVNVFKSLNENKSNIEKHRDRGDDTQEIRIILDDDSEIGFSTSWSFPRSECRPRGFWACRRRLTSAGFIFRSLS